MGYEQSRQVLESISAFKRVSKGDVMPTIDFNDGAQVEHSNGGFFKAFTTKSSNDTIVVVLNHTGDELTHFGEYHLVDGEWKLY